MVQWRGVPMESWCDGLLLKKHFHGTKKIFFIIHCLNQKKTFEELFKLFIWQL